MSARRLISPGFIARAPELAALESALDSARGGGPVVALVAGEAGIGKSRLLDEFSSRAFASGARVLRGSSSIASRSGLPFAPIVQALRSAPPDTIAALPESIREELAVLLPELASAGAPDESPRHGEAASTRLFGAVLLLLEQLGSDAPLVVMVEDVHWMDPSSQDLLAFLASGVSPTAMLFVLSFRPDELGERPAPRLLVADLQRAARTVRVDVQPLSRSDTAAQIGAIAGEVPDLEAVDRIFGRSEGNPFFTEELVAADRDGLDQPAHVRDLLLMRFDHLGEPARAVVRVAAAVGRSVDHQLLAAIAATPEDRLEEAIREALAAHVLVLDEGGEGYTFRHALLHETIARELLPGERTRLHAQIAALLSERDGEAGATRLAEIARHLELAHDLPGALRASVAAALAADAVSAAADALVHYDRALDLWEKVPEAETVAAIPVAELLQRAGEASWLGAGDPQGAARRFERAREALDPGDVLGRADLTSRLALCAWEAGGSVRDEGKLHEQALAMLPDEPTEIGARVLARQASYLMVAGELEAGALTARRAMAMAQETGSLRDEADAAVTLFSCLGLGAHPDEALELIQSSRGLVIESRSPRILQRWVSNAMAVLHNWSRYEEALALGREGLELLPRHGLGRHAQLCALGTMAGLLTTVGRIAEAEELIGRERAKVTADSIAAHIELANINRVAGEWAEARGVLDRLGDPTAMDAHYAIPILCCRAEIAVWEGGLDEAGAAVAAAEPLLPPEDFLSRSRFLAVAMRVQAERSDRAEADRLIEHLETFLGSAAVLPPSVLANAQLARAERSRLAGRPDPAPWSATAETWDALGHPYEATYSRLREAQSLAATGGRTQRRIAAVVRPALATADGAGFQQLSAELRDVARRSGVALAEPREPGAFGELTEREREVLRLVSAGRTNPQIAEELFISGKTASSHVSSILFKLGVSSRGEASAVAHESGFMARDLIGSRAPE